jgi:hypothetical protein
MNGKPVRWKTCLHEAGHAVAGRLPLKRTIKAVVYSDDVGAAYLEIDGGIPRTFEEALAVAAGPAAESLADQYAAPQVQPAPALEAAYPEPSVPLKAQLRQSPSDAVAIARWCIGGVEKQPDRWIRRYNWIHREARILVARHRQEIVEAAVDLFRQGAVTLQAEPAYPAPAQVCPPRHR